MKLRSTGLVAFFLAVENFDAKVQGKLLRAFETGSTAATMIRVMNQSVRIQGRGIFDVAQFFAMARRCSPSTSSTCHKSG